MYTYVYNGHSIPCCGLSAERNQYRREPFPRASAREIAQRKQIHLCLCLCLSIFLSLYICIYTVWASLLLVPPSREQRLGEA